MPRSAVVFYAEPDGTCPFLEWLDQQQPKVQDKCLVRTERLAELGYEMRRPEADTLRDGIHELRVSYRRVQYRVLYFFHQGVAVLSHGIIKESRVPDIEIERAKERREAYGRSPADHAYREPV